MSRAYLEVTVVVGWVALLAGLCLFLGLFALSRGSGRVARFKARVSDRVLGGLLLAFVVPGGIVAAFGRSILEANTSVYPNPEDFRNSATFVNICWFFVMGVAPAFVLLGFVLFGLAFWRAGRQHLGATRGATRTPTSSKPTRRGKGQ